MKKKFLVFAMLVCVGVSLLGCGKSTFNLVCDNMSEWTKVYYFGENEDFYCSLSSGLREDNYLLNGTSEKKVDFALLTLNLTENSTAKILKVKVKIDGMESEKEMELNNLNNSYMLDLEQQLKGTENIEITYDGKSLILQNLSKDFVVDGNKALEIAAKELEEKILLKKTYNKLNAECYLRVLDKKANDFDGIFWCFTVLNCDNENYSIIISTVDGSILAKSK